MDCGKHYRRVLIYSRQACAAGDGGTLPPLPMVQGGLCRAGGYAGLHTGIMQG